VRCRVFISSVVDP